MSVEHELLSSYDARYLAFHVSDRDRALALRAQLAGLPPIASVEIGANTGAFLIGQARTWAPRPVIGIEWQAKHLGEAADRIARSGVTNAYMLHADARIALPLLVDPGTLECVSVLFPDPWWKKRHAARRVLDPVMLRIIARRLVADGRLYLKSDVFDYLYRVREMARVSGALEPLRAELWPSEATWSLSTRERKCMHMAIPFGRGYYRRRADFDDTLPTEPESNDLWPIDETIDPEAVIRGPAPFDVHTRALASTRKTSDGG